MWLQGGSSMNSEDYQHALHESSHAVPAWFEGVKLHQLTIVGPIHVDISEDRQTPYYCEARYPAIVAFDNDGINAENVFLRINSILAPHVVAEKLTGEKLSGGFYDILEAIDLLTWNYQNSEVNNLVESARRAVDENPNNRKACAIQFYNENNGPVKKCLDDPKMMKAIQKLADFLLKRGRLTGYEVVHFLENVWEGDLPKKARPAGEHSAGVKTQSLENTISAALRLHKMALEILHEFRPQNEEEEEVIDKAIRQTLNWVFNLEGLMHR